MDRIHYAGNSVLTGSAIATALLEYAEVLAKAGTSATVDIPILEEDGSVGRSKLLIGPASQLIADAEESEFEEIVDEDLVAYFRAETATYRQAPAAALLAEEAEVQDVMDDI
jgi:hypothetical protein